MAQQGKPLDDSTKRYIERLREVLSVRKTAREAGVDAKTVQKYGGKKDGRRMLQ